MSTPEQQNSQSDIQNLTGERIMRPLITLSNGLIKHNGTVCLVTMRRELIRIGCTEVTPEAAEFIWTHYQKHFQKPALITIQQGE